LDIRLHRAVESRDAYIERLNSVLLFLSSGNSLPGFCLQRMVCEQEAIDQGMAHYRFPVGIDPRAASYDSIFYQRGSPTPYALLTLKPAQGPWLLFNYLAIALWALCLAAAFTGKGWGRSLMIGWWIFLVVGLIGAGSAIIP
jgi:hypothetical protein